MLRLKWTALAIAALTATQVQAQSAAPPAIPFSDSLAQAATPLGVGPDGFSGPGADVLTQAVAASRYVLIGESHHSREIPAFTTQICRLMAPSGLTALAVEIGPEAARVVDARMRAPDRDQQIDAFMRAHPHAMIFLNSDDEARMAADCADAAGPDFSLWGLDQEFLGASGHLLEQMLAADPGPLARAEVESLMTLERASTRAALESGSPGDLFLFTVTNEALDKARAAIARDGGERAQELFEGLSETHAIYHASQAQDGDPNGRRARLMKRTLHARLEAQPEARVVMKFGAWHLYKNLNPLDQRDLGAFVAERADGEGVNSLHIAVLGARGSEAGYSGVGRPAAVSEFDVMTEDGDDWRKDATLARPAGMAAGDWLLVDLRRLRTPALATYTPEWRRLVLGYDLAILAPTLTATRFLGAHPVP